MTIASPVLVESHTPQLELVISGVNGAADYRNQGVVNHRGPDCYVGYEVAKLTEGRQTPVTMVPLAADFGVAARLPR